jgi:hypothetical protein
MLKKSLLIMGLAGTAVLLSGCAAIGTAIKHRNLQTQTLMSKAVFLDPVPNREKTVFVQVHNTTDKPNFNIQPQLISNLMAKGYRIKQDPDLAHYVLQVDVLSVGRASKTAASEMMHMGYGGALEGAAAGASTMAVAGGDHILAGGIVGAVAGTVADNMVQDVNYSGVVDIKITEKKPSHKHAHKVYRTRIATTADKVNLKFATAEPKLENGIAHSIAGLF